MSEKPFQTLAMRAKQITSLSDAQTVIMDLNIWADVLISFAVNMDTMNVVKMNVITVPTA